MGRRQHGGRAVLLIVALIVMALSLSGCGPEATRGRGGEGADTGNRDSAVETRGDQSPEESIYYHTPRKLDQD